MSGFAITIGRLPSYDHITETTDRGRPGSGALTAGPAASASVALGHDLHQGQVDISVGTQISQQIFWSDTYSDLRTEHYLTYVPNSDVLPTVPTGTPCSPGPPSPPWRRTWSRAESGWWGGINGDYYAMSTGSPVGLVITDASSAPLPR